MFAYKNVSGSTSTKDIREEVSNKICNCFIGNLQRLDLP